MRWLEDFVASQGLLKALGWTTGALSLVSAILALVASGAVGIVAMSAAGLAALLIIAVEARVRRRLRGLTGEDGNRIVKMLRDHVLKLAEADWTYEHVRAVFSIRRRGDTTYTRTFSLRVTGDAPLHFFSVKTTGEELSRRQRRRVKPLVQLGEEHGGGRLPFQADWESPARLAIWIYLPEPRQPEETITLSVHLEWPHLFPGLASNQSESGALRG
jgi:hypothetical protein